MGPHASTIEQMVIDQAQFACRTCKKRKRKCDKGVPQCTLCKRKNLSCSYGSSDGQESGDENQNARIGNLSAENSFPTVFFLDHDVFQHGLMEIPKPIISVPIYISRLVGDYLQVRNVATLYFGSVHTYMPIVSKRVFYDRLLNPLLPLRADVVLLCLCMKLVIWSPSTNDAAPKTESYLSAKQYATELDLSGTFTIQALQALVLIALYEFGHGIYPSAYMTIKTCAAYGLALGLDFRSTAQGLDQISWIETEERRRVWWAILILERVMNLGSPNRTLATDDPTPYDLLPADDLKWDQGIIGSNYPINMSASVSDINLGRFARQAHATHLLGQVFQNFSKPFIDESSQYEEVQQLDRTLRALIVVCGIECERTNLRYCNPVAICSSALFVLHSRYILPNTTTSTSAAFQQHKDSWTAMKDISKKIATTSNSFIYMSLEALSQVSPVVLHSTYKSASMFIRLIGEGECDASIKSLEVLKSALETKNKRWQAARLYLQIIEAQALMNSY